MAATLEKEKAADASHRMLQEGSSERTRRMTGRRAYAKNLCKRFGSSALTAIMSGQHCRTVGWHPGVGDYEMLSRGVERSCQSSPSPTFAMETGEVVHMSPTSCLNDNCVAGEALKVVA